MIVMVKNPNDPSKSVQLSREQVVIVHDYVIQCLNENQGRGQPKDSMIIRMLEEAGNPAKFG
jgi:hypothetical protein